MAIKPTKMTNCFFILSIGMEAYLSDEDPSKSMDPSDVDHLYREIVEGIYYPLKNNDYVNGKKIVGFFYDINAKEYVNFYNNEFYTDAEWKPISETYQEVMFEAIEEEIKYNRNRVMNN